MKSEKYFLIWVKSSGAPTGSKFEILQFLYFFVFFHKCDHQSLLIKLLYTTHASYLFIRDICLLILIAQQFIKYLLCCLRLHLQYFDVNFHYLRAKNQGFTLLISHVAFDKYMHPTFVSVFIFKKLNPTRLF
jgi:hypothetical protein